MREQSKSRKRGRVKEVEDDEEEELPDDILQAAARQESSEQDPAKKSKSANSEGTEEGGDEKGENGEWGEEWDEEEDWNEDEEANSTVNGEGGTYLAPKNKKKVGDFDVVVLDKPDLSKMGMQNSSAVQFLQERAGLLASRR
jgi:hypothetical protein